MSAETFVSSDIDMLHDMNREVGWNAEYRQLEPGSLRVASSVREVGGLSILWEQADRRLELAAEPLGEMVSVVVPAIEKSMAFNGLELGPGAFGLFTPRSELLSVSQAHTRAWSLQIPVRSFARHMRSLEPDGERFSCGRGGVVCANPEAFRQLQAAIESGWRFDGHGIAESELESQIVCAVVECLGLAAPPASRRSAIPSVYREVVLVAREYIEAHLDRPIRMPDLCRVCGTSLKTLERAFRREMQMTPMAYIRVRRLDAVRRELASPNARHLSIARIATSHGFSHLGRFSLAYRRHFGRQPREARKASARA